MSGRHTEYLRTIRAIRDTHPRGSYSWRRADDDLRAVVDAFHSTDHIEYEEMLSELEAA